MDLNEWLDIYRRIVIDLDISTENDVEVARFLSKGLREKKNIFDPNETVMEAIRVIRESTCYILGASSELEEQIDVLMSEKELIRKDSGIVVISADGATSPALKRGIVPDVIVTDLDGGMSDQLRCLREGSIMVLHAHGDNLDRIREALPDLQGMVIPTTQVDPVLIPGTFNFGGFTDGDRAANFAAEMGAKKIILVGFDTEIPGGKITSRNGRRNLDKMEEKRKLRKLSWAREILGRLKSVEISYFETDH